MTRRLYSLLLLLLLWFVVVVISTTRRARTISTKNSSPWWWLSSSSSSSSSSETTTTTTTATRRRRRTTTTSRSTPSTTTIKTAEALILLPQQQQRFVQLRNHDSYEQNPQQQNLFVVNKNDALRGRSTRRRRRVTKCLAAAAAGGHDDGDGDASCCCFVSNSRSSARSSSGWITKNKRSASSSSSSSRRLLQQKRQIGVSYSASSSSSTRRQMMTTESSSSSSSYSSSSPNTIPVLDDDQQKEEEKEINRTPDPLGRQQEEEEEEEEESDNNDDDDTSSSSSLPPIPIEWRNEVLNSLRTIIDPDLGNDIVSLGFVQNLELVVDDENNENERLIKFDVELTTPACPIKEQFATECEQNVMQLPWTKKVQVTMTAQQHSDNAGGGIDDDGMNGVSNIIAVSSCKGGVGKSTTAVNLAYTLSSMGASVGIFDTDIYGPSLPTMIEPDDDIVRFIGRRIAPLKRSNVRLMSFGYINDNSAAIMRGPMITQLLDQFMSVTHWGQLDYLILDMPPGTGDIQLTLTQRLNITAAIIVTTPQELSYTDVKRGIDMFDSVMVPSIAVVENMAYYIPSSPPPPPLETTTSTKKKKKNDIDDTVDTPSQNVVLLDEVSLKNAFVDQMKTWSLMKTTNDNDNDANVMNDMADDLVQIVIEQQQQQQKEMKKDKTDTDDDTDSDDNRVYLFGPGHRDRLSNQYGIEHTFSIPLSDRISKNGDSGTPYVLEYPNSDVAMIYKQLASSVVQEISKMKYNNSGKYYNTKPIISYDEELHKIIWKQQQPQPQQQKDEINVANNEAVQGRNQTEDGSYSSSSSSSNTGTSSTTTTIMTMTPAELRRSCRCALCVEEMTGRQILIKTNIPETIRPIKMNPTGNYALSVDWSDGHRSLYPYKQIRTLLQQQEQEQQESVL